MDNYKSLAIRKITFYFTILCALFLMLSSQFTGAILPLLFILPIIMGSIGIKRSRKSGYLIATAIVPLSFAISVLWIRYSISVFSDFSNQISMIGIDYNISVKVAGIMTICFFVLSIIMIIISIILFVQLRKNKKLFT
ncbi:hypothetical protein [Clostridium lacusfryxellense]|uniref:hypothetical protein n=1 Tax=Clostridium lacusfryxellense TaxID=205328 RepID=UPI001C0BD7D8|nr:hypothetical protein [Clostridium lacusfryxellense]MBU3111896.1 hypothetical protein [Clostridium lacusfryxellense]